jgi:formate hydrogenlyase subunit 6/NADH:ubiquinone oxidoreductase subunit I
MKVGTMLRDILRSLFRKPITEDYPAERQAAPERLRGKLVWNPEKCVGCCLCAKDCPSNALELITIDKANKRFVMRYDVGRCTFCAQCVLNCRFSCLEMSNEQWELAAGDKAPFTVYYGREEDVEALLAHFTPDDSAKER